MEFLYAIVLYNCSPCQNGRYIPLMSVPRRPHDAVVNGREVEEQRQGHPRSLARCGQDRRRGQLAGVDRVGDLSSFELLTLQQ